MKKILALLIPVFVVYYAHSQGCVAIRSNGATCTMTGHHDDMAKTTANGWTVGFNSRYFRSFRHFVGTEEQKQRQEQGSEVINHSFSTELGLTHTLNARWAWSIFIPVISNKRSSLYEHDQKNRYDTHS